MNTARLFLLFGGINAMLAVMLGAFGAHAARARLSAEMMAIYHTGSQYHFYHALGLLAVGLAAWHLPGSALLRWSGWLMLFGIVVFCGSLYVLSLTGMRWMGAITPIGGLAFIAAWLLFALAIWRAA